MFEEIKQAIVADRYAYFDDFFANFYNTDVLAPERIGEAAVRASFNVAAAASPYASYACVDTWLTDFRADLPKIDVPTLVLHGTADRVLPFEATAARLQRREAHRRSDGGPYRERPAQHRLDLRRRGQRRDADVPQGGRLGARSGGGSCREPVRRR